MNAIMSSRGVDLRLGKEMPLETNRGCSLSLLGRLLHTALVNDFPRKLGQRLVGHLLLVQRSKRGSPPRPCRAVPLFD